MNKETTVPMEELRKATPPQIGELKIIFRRYLQRECEECGEPATHRLTYLLENARTNPSSAGYGKDDISWCSDASRYACDVDANAMRRVPPTAGMEWCSDYVVRVDDSGELVNRHHVCEWREEMILFRDDGSAPLGMPKGILPSRSSRIFSELATRKLVNLLVEVSGADLPAAITKDAKLSKLMYWGDLNRCLSHPERGVHAIGTACEVVEAEPLYSIELDEEDDEMQAAVDRQIETAERSVSVDRGKWTAGQWIEDAEKLMNEPDGAVTSLLNGHALALIQEGNALRKELAALVVIAKGVRIAALVNTHAKDLVGAIRELEKRR